VSYPGNFGSEAFDMLSFFGQKTLRDKNGKVSVLMTGFFEFSIEESLNIFPDCITYGLMIIQPLTGE